MHYILHHSVTLSKEKDHGKRSTIQKRWKEETREDIEGKTGWETSQKREQLIIPALAQTCPLSLFSSSEVQISLWPIWTSFLCPRYPHSSNHTAKVWQSTKFSFAKNVLRAISNLFSTSNKKLWGSKISFQQPIRKVWEPKIFFSTWMETLRGRKSFFSTQQKALRLKNLFSALDWKSLRLKNLFQQPIEYLWGSKIFFQNSIGNLWGSKIFFRTRMEIFEAQKSFFRTRMEIFEAQKSFFRTRMEIFEGQKSFSAPDWKISRLKNRIISKKGEWNTTTDWEKSR